MLKGIVWDFDGTIVDTETPQFEAWDALFRDHGLALDQELWSQMVGTVTSWDLFTVLEDRAGPINRAVLSQRVNTLIYERLKAAPLRAGVAELMAEAHRAHILQAIASSSGRRWIREFSARHRLGPYIRMVASADDVSQVKPHPEVYQLAVSRLGLVPDECLAMEDSAHGATSALAAGLTCVVVPNPSTRALTFPEGIVLKHSHQDLTIADLQAMLE